MPSPFFIVVLFLTKGGLPHAFVCNQDRRGIDVYKRQIQEEDVLTYAMFPQVAPKFFEKRNAGVQGVDALQADYENKSHPV